MNRLRLKRDAANHLRRGFIFCRGFIAVTLLVFVYLPSPALFADTTNWRLARQELDQEYQQRIEQLAEWCQQNDLPQQVEATLQLGLPRDVNRQIFFIPSELPEGIENGETDVDLAEWSRKVAEIRHWQADRIYQLATKAAEAEAGAAAIRLLNEVLYYNRDHEDARRALGHRRQDDGWQVYPDRIQIRRSIRPHDLIGWSAQSYYSATTANFQIDSNASEEETRFLAEKLERWHYVWRQAFFAYWSNNKVVARWIEGKGSYTHPRRKFRVVFFKNRADYLTTLGALVPGVEDSTGYYSNVKNCSFFYNSTSEKIQETWRHELTHQLFRESIGSSKNLKIFESEYVWLDEGLATYFESLVDFGAYVSLGGFEASRSQYARIGLFLQNFSLPMEKLAGLGRIELQQHPQVLQIYSQMAAQMDMLLNDHAGQNEAAVVEILFQLYRGRAIRPGRFEQAIGSSYAELDQRYREFMVVQPDHLIRFLSAPLSRTELSFGGSNLDDESFEVIGQCHHLIWLDLSGNRITKTRIEILANCKNLKQLILTRCQIEPGALRSLSQFEKLAEIDLTGSSVSDQQLLELQNQTNLQKIHLKATRVTPAGISRLQQLLPNTVIRN